MDKSWFSKATMSKYSLSPNANHELPRWRSPSPMAASMIPPPIVQSTYAPSPKSVARSVIIEKPTPLQDRQGELEADLQFLLDAQAEGLVRGIEGGGAHDERGSTGSTTPTTSNVRGVSARRSARPLRKKLGLRSARKGIYNSMLALSDVKSGELQALDQEAQGKETELARMDEWEQKREGLQRASRDVDESEETIRAQRLRQSADALQQDINKVELQLEEMKIRHRKLVRQVAAVENSVQAKLASYTSSLGMLEAEIQEFLKRTPPEGKSRPVSRDEGRTSMWQLPAKQRTLEMAREQLRDERDDVLQARQSVEYEKAALDDGAAMWGDAVKKITTFEKTLRDEMASMSDLTSSHSAWEEQPSPQQAATSQDRLRQVMDQLDAVLHDLETKLSVAEQKDWKLLIAAIGAEIDALRQGKQIIQGVLGVGDEHQQELVDTSEQASENGSSKTDEGKEIDALDERFGPARPAMRRQDSEDDPAELLFSRQDLGHD